MVSKEKFLNELRKIGVTAGAVSVQAEREMMKVLRTDDHEVVFLAVVTMCMKLLDKVEEDRPYLRELFEKNEIISNLQAENAALKVENQELAEELKITNEVLQQFNGHAVQREKVKKGMKIARRSIISMGTLFKMLENGYTVSEIALHYGVSRDMVYARMDDLKKAHVDVKSVRATGKQRRLENNNRPVDIFGRRMNEDTHMNMRMNL